MLWCMGFGFKWIRQIEECVSSTQFSILINGTPKGFFPVSRGLKQGDPLPPFLFIIVGEAFSQMLGAVGKVALITCFSPTPRAPTVSHLQVADDTIIFCEADEDQIKNVKAILQCFDAVLGLKVNFFKSDLLGIRMGDHSMQRFANILGSKVGSFPSYLGFYHFAQGGH